MAQRLLWPLAALLAAGCWHADERPKATPTPMADTPVMAAAGATAAVPARPSRGLPSALPADADRLTPRVFAFFQPWFEGLPANAHWPAEGQGVMHPAIGLYDSRDEAVLGYQLLLLKGAGFDGAVVAWHGGSPGSFTATRTLFSLARRWDERYGLRFSLMLALDAVDLLDVPRPKRARELQNGLEQVLVAFGEASQYQRLEGKPVVFFLPRQEPQRLTVPVVDRRDWNRVRASLKQPFLLAYRDAGPTGAAAADLPFAWPPPTRGGDDDGGSYLDWFYGSQVILKSRGWSMPTSVGVVYPGRGEDGPNRLAAIPRSVESQPTLGRTWQHVFDHNAQHPDARIVWVQTASWNDWGAGTAIEPSLERGSSDYEQAAAQNQRFTGVKTAPKQALAVAQAYLAGCRAGKREEDFAPALEQMGLGDVEAALHAMPPVAPPVSPGP